MCLTAPKEGSLKIATEPVKVYKVITEDSKSPFYTSYEYHQGKNVATGPQIISDCPHYFENAEPWIIIEGGFLHACSDYDVACRIKIDCNWLYTAYGNVISRNCHVVEMYIPAGTKYYEFMGEVASPVLEWPEKP
jgi:hypothetical protein